MTEPRDQLIRRHRMRAARRRTVGAAVLGVLTGVAVLAAGMVAVGTVGLHPLGAPVASGTWRVPASAPTPARSSGVGEHLPKPPKGQPTWVLIPSIGVSAALEVLTLDTAGELNPPANTDDAGWYAGGTPPGDVGPAVIAGHVDSKCCKAVFFRLSELRAGDIVEVERGGQWLKFTVTGSGRYPKADFPTSDVYDPTPDAELRLITCGGDFDKATGSYVDNVVVYAVATI